MRSEKKLRVYTASEAKGLKGKPTSSDWCNFCPYTNVCIALHTRCFPSVCGKNFTGDIRHCIGEKKLCLKYIHDYSVILIYMYTKFDVIPLKCAFFNLDLMFWKAASKSFVTFCYLSGNTMYRSLCPWFYPHKAPITQKFRPLRTNRDTRAAPAVGFHAFPSSL